MKLRLWLERSGLSVTISAQQGQRTARQEWFAITVLFSTGSCSNPPCSYALNPSTQKTSVLCQKCKHPPEPKTSVAAEQVRAANNKHAQPSDHLSLRCLQCRRSNTR